MSEETRDSALYTTSDSRERLAFLIGNPALNLCNLNQAVKELNVAMRDCGNPDLLLIALICAQIRVEAA